MTAYTPEQIQHAVRTAGVEADLVLQDQQQRWQQWAEALSTLARTMPGVPTGVRSDPAPGHTIDVTPDELGHDAAHPEAMRRQLDAVRAYADAYAAVCTRAVHDLWLVSTSADHDTEEWVGARYFPQHQRDDEGDPLYLVIDRGADLDGWWPASDDHGTTIAYTHDLSAAEDLANALNFNPTPYPDEAPRGRYIAVDTDNGFVVVDRGDDPTHWLTGTWTPVPLTGGYSTTTTWTWTSDNPAVRKALRLASRTDNAAGTGSIRETLATRRAAGDTARRAEADNGEGGNDRVG